MSYRTLLDEYTKEFAREFGDRKLRKIVNKTYYSKSVGNALQKLKELDTNPGSEDIVATVMNMPYFMFGKKESIGMASVIFLDIWNQKLNVGNKYLDDHELSFLFEKVLNHCKKML